MKAVILKEIGKYEVVEKPMPEIKHDDEMLVSIECSSICGSDIHILADPPGIPAKIGATIGHEMVCRVEKIGSGVKTFSVGDRIVLDPNVPCGNCEYCRIGRPNMCRSMRVLGVDEDGAFGEYTIVPEKTAVKISPDLPAEVAVFAEPLTCVLSAVNKVRLLPGENVLVLGAGPIGQYFIRLFKANGAGKVIVSEVSEYRREFAKKSGADRVIDPLKENLAETVRAETGGIGADVVVDAVGMLFSDAAECARCGGRIVLFGQNQATTQTVKQCRITLKELTVFGSYIGLFTLPNTVKLLESGLIDFTDLITHRITIDEFGVGLDAMKKGTAMEVVVYPNK